MHLHVRVDVVELDSGLLLLVGLDGLGTVLLLLLALCLGAIGHGNRKRSIDVGRAVPPRVVLSVVGGDGVVLAGGLLLAVLVALLGERLFVRIFFRLLFLMTINAVGGSGMLVELVLFVIIGDRGLVLALPLSVLVLLSPVPVHYVRGGFGLSLSLALALVFASVVRILLVVGPLLRLLVKLSSAEVGAAALAHAERV
jgi:hypothetical protein